MTVTRRAAPAARAAAGRAVAEPSADAAQRSAPREDTSHDGLMAALADEPRTSALVGKMQLMARTRYGIRAQDAEDLFHEAVATYLQIHSRYPSKDNHFGILVGIYQRKALEFLDASRREGRIAQRYATRLQADRPVVARGEDPSGDAADCVIREEDAQLIRRAIHSLSDEGRDMLLALADGSTTRLDMIEALGINPNTFDTRLRTLRLRLRKELESAGVTA
ncbi:MAG: hypothetical protein HMLKMBBP_01054 [Planctomycetes bacterium]|nr:hypothetical protein [Planctomycetota bacterium]